MIVFVKRMISIERPPNWYVLICTREVIIYNGKDGSSAGDVKPMMCVRQNGGVAAGSVWCRVEAESARQRCPKNGEHVQF